MAKIGKAITDNLAQFLLIVFSVVLGLYLSERIEEGKKRRESEELLSVIKSELVDNRALMNDWAPYHVEIYRKLDSLRQDEQFVQAFIQDQNSLFGALLTRGTFLARQPSGDAWDIAKSHPLVVNINYDQLLALSKVYNQQAITFDPLGELFQLISGAEVNAPDKAATNLALATNRLRELVAREQQLLYYYDEAGKTLGVPAAVETR